MKIVHQEAETHDFYSESSSDFYLWFAQFDRIHQRPKSEMDLTPNPPKYDFLRPSEICLGLSPRSAKEKQKIAEKYRQMHLDCVVGVQGKMTRLTQRRHSTSQKISKISTGGVKLRKSGLQDELGEINEEIKQIEISGKETISRIAAARERELAGLRGLNSSCEYLDESDDESFPNMTTLTLESQKRAKKKNRLSGIRDKPLKKIQSFARSLSRSKSAAENDRKFHFKIKKEFSTSSVNSVPFDRPKSMIDFQKELKNDFSSKNDDFSSNVSSRGAILSIHQSSFDDEELFQSTTDLDRKEKIKKYNLSKLDKSTLDEIQKFDNFVTKFGQKSASDQPFRENLIWLFLNALFIYCFLRFSRKFWDFKILDFHKKRFEISKTVWDFQEIFPENLVKKICWSLI